MDNLLGEGSKLTMQKQVIDFVIRGLIFIVFPDYFSVFLL